MPGIFASRWMENFYPKVMRKNLWYSGGILLLLSGCVQVQQEELSPHSTDIGWYPTSQKSLSAKSISAHTRIMGKSICTARKMRLFLQKSNQQISIRYLRLPEMYLLEGAKEGVRGDLAFAQAIHETDCFRFGGDVLPTQNNFAGLGATGNGVRGHSFRTMQLGVRAHIQHLKAYASTARLAQPCVDPRFSYVKNRGCAPYLEDLSGKWAVPGFDKGKYPDLKTAQRCQDSYADKIKKLYHQIRAIP